MTLVDFSAFSTGFTFPENMLILDHEFGFGILALSAQYEFIDEHVEKVLKFILVMGSIDDVTLCRSVADNLSLSTEFEAEEFGDVDGWTSEVVCNVQDVGDDCFDAVAFSFNLRD